MRDKYGNIIWHMGKHKGEILVKAIDDEEGQKWKIIYKEDNEDIIKDHNFKFKLFDVMLKEGIGNYTRISIRDVGIFILPYRVNIDKGISEPMGEFISRYKLKILYDIYKEVYRKWEK